jgi:hypothetical protein
MKTGKHYLGKCDYNGDGRRNCAAYITWELRDGRFSMQTEIWQPDRKDCLCCGQCVDTVAALFPDDAKAQRMFAIWQRWHLNDMRAGSPVQEEWLRQNPIPESECAYPKSHYDVASAKLAAAGLNPDADGYKYGHAWKTEELPADVIVEIESWNYGATETAIA